MLLSFVIPCYRSEKTIEKVYQEIVETVAQRPQFDYEIIFVNDCSPDGVLGILRTLARRDNRVRVLDFAKNFGKHSAMMAGYRHARGDIIVNLDDDFQCPVYELWRLVDPLLQEGYDCASAVYEKKREAAWKRLGSAVNAWMTCSMLNQPPEIELENFSVLKRFVCDEIVRYPNPYPYMAGLILRATHNIKMVPMQERERGDDTGTTFTFQKSFSLLLNGLTSFSVKPLRLATFCGLTFAVMGFLCGLWAIVRKILHPAVLQGYTSMIAVQLFSSGMIMLMLGLIGEYLGRIYISINNAPQYVIREKINIPDGEPTREEG